MHAALLLSGGVDSSVALVRLQESGARVTAFYLKVWLEEELAGLGDCPWQEDLEYARAVCDQRRVPLHVVSVQQDYLQHVLEYAVRELRAGNTPSPDLMCNRHIKFGVFTDRYADGFDTVATGHYARVVHTGDGPRLRTAPDPVKDQTYFLAYVSERQLERASFPIGDAPKARVRAEAAARDLPTRARPDSQGICFLGRISYRDFVRRRLGELPGPIVERETGRLLGEHRGHHFFTVGQRQGLGLGDGPWYVVGKDASENRVTVSRSPADHAQHAFALTGANWIGGDPPRGAARVKVRHGPVAHACTVASTTVPDRMMVRTDSPLTVAPGQFAVLYDGEECRGGGVIEPLAAEQVNGGGAGR